MLARKKTIVWGVIALLSFIAIVRLVLTVLIPPAAFCVDKAQSPDKRYIAKAVNIWYGDYWGRKPHENHYFSIKTMDGQTIRRIHVSKAWTGWPYDCEIRWATNSSSVTFIYYTNDAFSPRLVLNVSPSS
jgi:hypothetical protein